MSWTDANTVKIHLLGFLVNGLEVVDHEITLEGSAEIQLPHRNLLSGSVRVAGLLAENPSGPEQLTLNGTSWQGLGVQNVLRNSVVLTDDLALSTRFIENVDFAVDAVGGKVKRLSGSSIGDGESVYVWFIPLTLYSNGSDYDVDLSAGTLERLVGGDIPDPATMLVSYEVNEAAVTDTLISEAIVEAEDKIAALLKLEYDTESSDQGLKTGATELTLAIISDSLALHSLGGGTDSHADDRARRLMELARRFELRAQATLSRFISQPLPSELQLK
ncbi:hypothetical protein K8I28_16030 [bacterium]|nr:hypothetical protein [bacterium]